MHFHRDKLTSKGGPDGGDGGRGSLGGGAGSAGPVGVPVAFPLVMAFRGLLGLLGVPIPGMEIGIAVSGLVMGLMVLFELRPQLLLAVLIVSTFVVFHGHAHGAELRAGSDALLYSLAFVIATGLLHLAGILLGETRRWPGGRRFVQAADGVMAWPGCCYSPPSCCRRWPARPWWLLPACSWLWGCGCKRVCCFPWPRGSPWWRVQRSPATAVLCRPCWGRPWLLPC